MNRSRTGLWAAAFVAAPVLVGLGYSTLGALGLVGAGGGELTFERVGRVLTDGAVWSGLAWTLWIAGASTLLATVGATVLAVVFRSAKPLDRTARLIALVPLPIPHIVAAVGGVLILGQSGFISRIGASVGLFSSPADMPALVYDPLGLGLVLSLTWKEIPFLSLVAFSILATRGAALEETAESLGAGRIQILRRVTWPALWRGLLPAIVAVFTFVAGTYEATALMAPSNPLALPLLTMERYTDAALANRADAFVLVLLGIGVAAVAVALHETVRGSAETGSAETRSARIRLKS